MACLTRHGAECTLLIDAANRIGAVCAPLNWRLAAPEVAYVIGHSEARFVMVDREFFPLLQGQRLPLVLTDGAQDEHQGFHELSFSICEKFL